MHDRSSDLRAVMHTEVARSLPQNPDTSKKERQFALRFYIQKYGHFALRNFSLNFEIGGGGGGIFVRKKLCTLRYVFISKIYRIVLIPKYKRTYDQSDQIKK